MNQDYVLGLYEKSMPNQCSMREKLSAAGAAGFDFVELSVDETKEKLSRLKWNREDCFSLQRDMVETGVDFRSMCLSGQRAYPLGHPDPEMRALSLEILKKAIILAARLGIRVIQLAGYDVYYEPSTEETREAFGQGLRAGVEFAAREGVVLAFETMETPFLNTVEKAMYWVREINSPYLQVYPDMGNLTNAALPDKDVLFDLEQGRGHLFAVHLKETVPGVFREIPFGTGHVDFEAVTKKAFAMGVRRYVAESWYDGKENWQEVLRFNKKFLCEFLDRAAKEGGKG